MSQATFFDSVDHGFTKVLTVLLVLKVIVKCHASEFLNGERVGHQSRAIGNYHAFTSAQL